MTTHVHQFLIVSSLNIMFRGSLDSDTHLMLQAQREDYESFAVLVEKYRELVLAHLSRWTQNRAIAEELAQDVFLRVYRRRHSYQPSAKFGTWLFRITRNVALNYFRDEHHELQNISLNQPTSTGKPFEPPDHRRSIEELLLFEVRRLAIRNALYELPDRQRAMVIMHKYEDMDYREIAIAMGMSHSAVKAAMFRSYERLRSALAYLPVRPSKHLPE